MTGNCHAKQPVGFRLSSLLRRRPPTPSGGPIGIGIGRGRVLALLALALTIGAYGAARAGNPQGQLTWGVHITLAPTWFDPAETIQGASGAFGNAATRLEAFVAKDGAYAYGSYPDIDTLFAQQAAELDHARREATLHKIQQVVHDRTIYAHLWQLAFLNGAGPRVGESGLGLIPSYAYSAPYEDLTLAHQ